MALRYLHKVYILSKKEFVTYFNSPIAYVILAVFLVVSNWLFFNSFFFQNQASMRSFFSLLPWIFLFLIPAVTMRLWAEEKRSGTIEFLLTLPITDWQAVLGKFLGGVFFLLVALALTGSIPISLAYAGSPDWGVIIASYLGALLLGAAYLALGLCISSLTKNQIIAFVITVAIAFIFFIIGNSFVLTTAPHALAPLLQFLSIDTHFQSMARGVIDSKDVVYYFSFIWLWLWINKHIIESRDWK